MQFAHASAIWQAFPELVAGAIHAEGVHDRAAVQPVLGRYMEIARARLQAGSEADLPAVQAWRRAFARMGLKPTQYRCASEALLRRLGATADQVDRERARVHRDLFGEAPTVRTPTRDPR